MAASAAILRDPSFAVAANNDIIENPFLTILSKDIGDCDFCVGAIELSAIFLYSIS